MRRLFPFSVLLGVTLLLCGSLAVLLSSRQPARAQSQGQGNNPASLKIAMGEADPFTYTWVDAADGTVSNSDNLATQVHDQFANASWVFEQNGQLQVGHRNGTQITPIATLTQAANQDNSFFVYHFRSKDGKQFINGSANFDTATHGFAELTIVTQAADGTARSDYIEQNLSVVTGPPPSKP